MDDTQIKVGDVVKLKGGGTPGTVMSVITQVQVATYTGIPPDMYMTISGPPEVFVKVERATDSEKTNG